MNIFSLVILVVGIFAFEKPTHYDTQYTCTDKNSVDYSFSMATDVKLLVVKVGDFCTSDPNQEEEIKVKSELKKDNNGGYLNVYSMHIPSWCIATVMGISSRMGKMELWYTNTKDEVIGMTTQVILCNVVEKNHLRVRNIEHSLRG